MHASVRVLVELQCDAEAISAKHDPAKYDAEYRRIRSALRGRIVSPLRTAAAVDVSVEPLEPNDPLVLTLSRAAAWVRCSPWPETAHSAEPISCRIGACEVYMLVPDSLVGLAMGAVPPCIGLHSKLRTRKWPNLESLSQRCAAVLQPIFERWHADEEMRGALRSLRAASPDQLPVALNALRAAAAVHAGSAGFGLLADARCVMEEAATVVEADRDRREADASIRNAPNDYTRLVAAVEMHRPRASEAMMREAEARIARLHDADEALRRAMSDARADAAIHGGRRSQSLARVRRLRDAVAAQAHASPCVIAEAEEAIMREQQRRALALFTNLIGVRRLKLIMKLRAKARVALAAGMEEYAEYAESHTHKPTRWHSLALLQATAECDTSVALLDKLARHRSKATAEVVASAEFWVKMLQMIERTVATAAAPAGE